jgi:Nucleolar protein 11 C-terminal domain
VQAKIQWLKRGKYLLCNTCALFLLTCFCSFSLAIAFERAVVFVSIVASPVSLSSVLGSGSAMQQEDFPGDTGAISVSTTLDLERYLEAAFEGSDATVAQTQPELAPEASVTAAGAALSDRISSANAAEAAALSSLSSHDFTPATSGFWKVFSAFVSSRLVENSRRQRRRRSLVESGGAVEDSIPLLAAHEEHEWQLDDDDLEDESIIVKRLDVSQTFVATVLHRCLGLGSGFDDVSTIFSKPIRYLVRHKVVSLHSQPALTHGLSVDPMPKLLSAAMHAQDLDLLASVLHHVRDLSAVDLVKLVSFFLSGFGTSVARNGVKPEALAEFARARLARESKSDLLEEDLLSPDEITDEAVAIDYFLNCVVVLPLNDIAAQHALKYLTLEVVIRLLRYLLTWFRLHARYSAKFLSAQAAARRQQRGKHLFTAPTPELGDIVTWLSLVLDAHFAELVLVQECHDLMRAIQECTRDQVALCERLEPLAGFLDVFLNNKPVPEGRQTDYVVESLAL